MAKYLVKIVDSPPGAQYNVPIEMPLREIPMINLIHSGPGHRIPVSRRRSNIEIIADMLRVGKNGAGKTEIMYSANMSYSQLQRYLDFLVSQGFINRIEMDSSVVSYHLTDSGLKLLKAIDSLIELLGANEGNKVR